MAEKVLIGSCSYKGPDVHCVSTHHLLWYQLGKLRERGAYEFFLAEEIGNSLIGQARDRICQQAVDNGMDWVFMYDDDMRFNPDIFEKMITHRKPVIAALAFTARHPITPVLYKFHRSWDFAKQSERVDIQPIMDYPKNTLFQLDAIGTGVVLISVDVLRRLKSPWFFGAKNAGEDIFFCFKCRQAGIEVWCDTSIKTWHRPNEPLLWHGEETYEVLHRDTDLQELRSVAPLLDLTLRERRVPVQDRGGEQRAG